MNYNNLSFVTEENVLNDSVVVEITLAGSGDFWPTLHYR
jgi:hypothetical protein